MIYAPGRLYNASELNVIYMHHGDKEIFDSWFIFHDKRKEQTMSSVFIWQIFRQTYAVQIKLHTVWGIYCFCTT